MSECFFWYRPTRVVPDKRPLNGCVCVCMRVCVCVTTILHHPAPPGKLKKERILLQQNFTANIPLLTTTSIIDNDSKHPSFTTSVRGNLAKGRFAVPILCISKYASVHTELFQIKGNSFNSLLNIEDASLMSQLASVVAYHHNLL